MKNILLILFLALFAFPAYGYDIAFPLSNNLTLDQDGVFFIGKVSKNETIKINGRKINARKNGSFAESFKLSMGENIFCVESSINKTPEKYIVTRVLPKNNQTGLIEFPAQDFKTIHNGVILRSSPIDFGMNRIGYLPKNTDLQITGTKNEFSRVYLNNKESGWVMTKHIMPEQRENTVVGEFRGETINSDCNLIEYNYRFSKNLPYSIVYDNGKLLIDVYNVENRAGETFHTEVNLPTPNCYSAKMSGGVLSICLRQNALKSLKIVIDAGHGGSEHGAIGCLLDLEKDMNLKAAKALKAELKGLGYDVLLTRNSDKYLSLTDRVNFAIDKKGVVFVSLHMNSVPESSNPNEHKGTGTYYYNEFSKPLAEYIQSETVKSLGTYDNGITQASFAVIRPVEYVGVLVETAFMVNPDDVEIYKSKDYFKKAALGVASGIDKYIKTLQ